MSGAVRRQETVLIDRFLESLAVRRFMNFRQCNMDQQGFRGKALKAFPLKQGCRCLLIQSVCPFAKSAVSLTLYETYIFFKELF
jgi:hypothetical protein